MVNQQPTQNNAHNSNGLEVDAAIPIDSNNGPLAEKSPTIPLTGGGDDNTAHEPVALQSHDSKTIQDTQWYFKSPDGDLGPILASEMAKWINERTGSSNMLVKRSCDETYTTLANMAYSYYRNIDIPPIKIGSNLAAPPSTEISARLQPGYPLNFSKSTRIDDPALVYEYQQCGYAQNHQRSVNRMHTEAINESSETDQWVSPSKLKQYLERSDSRKCLLHQNPAPLQQSVQPFTTSNSVFQPRILLPQLQKRTTIDHTISPEQFGVNTNASMLMRSQCPTPQQSSSRLPYYSVLQLLPRLTQSPSQAWCGRYPAPMQRPVFPSEVPGFPMPHISSVGRYPAPMQRPVFPSEVPAFPMPHIDATEPNESKHWVQQY